MSHVSKISEQSPTVSFQAKQILACARFAGLYLLKTQRALSVADLYLAKKFDNVKNSSGIPYNLQEHHQEMTGTSQGVHRG